MNETTVRLPVTGAKKPDWEFMEGYVKSESFAEVGEF
jgi:hypothetical protein